MGVGKSVLQLIETNSQLQKTMDKFCLTPRHVARIHQLFLEGDIDNSNALNIGEFHLLFHAEADSPFLAHLFDVIDIDKDRKLTFVEFLYVIATFCCYAEVHMVKFAFDTFDRDRDGIVGESELAELVAKLDGKAGDATRTARRVMTMVDSDHNNAITIDEFAEMNLKYPHLLWPAFRLQYRIQEQTLGLSTWKKLQKKIKEKARPQHKQRAQQQKKRWRLFGMCVSDTSTAAVVPADSKDVSTISDPNTVVAPDGQVRKLNADRIRRQSTRPKKLSVASASNMRSRTKSLKTRGHAMSSSSFGSVSDDGADNHARNASIQYPTYTQNHSRHPSSHHHTSHDGAAARGKPSLMTSPTFHTTTHQQRSSLPHAINASEARADGDSTDDITRSATVHTSLAQQSSSTAHSRSPINRATTVHSHSPHASTVTRGRMVSHATSYRNR